MNNKYYYLLLLILGYMPAAWAQNDLSLGWANLLNHTQPEGGYIKTNSIKVDAQGNTYVIGTFKGTFDFDPSAAVMNLTSAGRNDVFMVKYDASGNYVFAKAIGGLGDDMGYSLAVDGSGNTYVTGSFQALADFDPSAGAANLTAIGGNDIFFAKYDASGNYIYAKSTGGKNNEIGKSIAIDGNGNVYLTGQFSGTADFNPSALTSNLASSGGYDAFLAKYDASGNYVYAKRMGGASDDIVNSVAVDGTGNVYITGQFQGTADFDPSAGTASLTSVGNDDIFLAKYDVLGNYVYANSMGGTLEDAGNSVAVDNLGNAYVTGFFRDTVDFDSSSGVANMTSSNYSKNIFLAKYDTSGNYLYAKHIGEGGVGIGCGLVLEGNGNAYVTGSFRGVSDFDPSSGVVNLGYILMNDNVFVAKYDTLGNYVYAKSIGGSSIERGNAVAVDSNGVVYVTGDFRETVDFDPSTAEVNITGLVNYDSSFVGKYDNLGNYIWAKGLINSIPEIYGASGGDITRDASGNIYVIGAFTGTVDFDPTAGVANLTSAGNNDVFLAKYDASGNYVYAKSIGGILEDYDGSLAVDSGGNVYITGIFEGTADFDPSAGVANLTSSPSAGYDVFLAKYDALGNYVFAKNIGGTGEPDFPAMAIDGSGNIYITGTFYDTVDFDPSTGVANLTSAGGYDIFLAKYDASGNYMYAKSMGGLNDDLSYSVAIDGNGNTYLTGKFSGTADFDPSVGVVNLESIDESEDVFLAKYNASGNYVYAKSFGGTDIETANSITVDGSGNCYIVGNFQGTADFDPSAGVANLVSAGSVDIFMAKYDSSGNYVYAKGFGGMMEDRGNSIVVDSSGNTYVTGWFQGTADLDPSVGVANYTSLGYSDIFLAKYDTAGNHAYTKIIEGPSLEFTSSLAIDGSGNVYVTGGSYGTTDFDPSEATYNLAATNRTSIFVARYNGTNGTAGVNDFILNNLKLYPNPVTNVLNIENEQIISSVEVYSITGQKVMVKEVNAMSTSIDMSGLTGGIYLVKVVAGDAVKALKVIKK